MGLAQIPVSKAISDRIKSTLIAPEHIRKVSDGHYFIDFGKDAFGTLVLTFKSREKDSVIIHLGEKLTRPSVIDKEPGGTIRYQKIKLTDIPLQKEYVIKLAVDKRNTGPKAIALPESVGVITPFRYCEIENLDVPIDDVIIRQKVYNYEFNDNSSFFTSSDTVLNKVWDMCKHTVKATSFAGLYIDGDRERIPYEADAYINQLSHYAVDNEYSIARNTNEFFIKHPTWPTEWILHMVPLFYYDFQYTGNKDLITKYYDDLRRRTLMEIAREDGLISVKSPLMTKEVLSGINRKQNLRDIVDWPTGERDHYDMVDVNTVVNSFHYWNLRLMAQIAGHLGKKADSIDFLNRSLLVKKTINDKLLDPATGLYVDGENSKHSSLHANMFPLAFGLVSESNRKTIIEFVKCKGMACSVYGAQYLLEGLYQQGQGDYALSLMTSKSKRSWWNMISTGSTMALEAWDMKYKPNSDWNHAWGTAPANIITRYMWGITPGSPGFKIVKIKPQLGQLKFSKIKVPTANGPIMANYKLVDENHALYTIELPRKVTGVFDVGENVKVFLNDRSMESTKPIFLNQGLNTIHVKW